MRTQRLVFTGLTILAWLPLVGFVLLAVTLGAKGPYYDLGLGLYVLGWVLGGIALVTHAAWRTNTEGLAWVALLIGAATPVCAPVALPVYWFFRVLLPRRAERQRRRADEFASNGASSAQLGAPRDSTESSDSTRAKTSGIAPTEGPSDRRGSDPLETLESNGQLLWFDTEFGISPFEFYPEFLDTVDRELLEGSLREVELEVDGDPWDRSRPVALQVRLPSGELLEREARHSDYLDLDVWVQLLNDLLNRLDTNLRVCGLWRPEMGQGAALAAGTPEDIREWSRADLPIRHGPGAA